MTTQVKLQNLTNEWIGKISKATGVNAEIMDFSSDYKCFIISSMEKFNQEAIIEYLRDIMKDFSYTELESRFGGTIYRLEVKLAA